MERLVDSRRRWLDVGCGRAPFPNNLALSADLAARCPHLVGVDPDENVHENSFVHQRFQLLLEHYSPSEQFDLISARMVVEHVTKPEEFVNSLARLAAPGAIVVIFTVNSRSASALLAQLTPMAVHHWAKWRLWRVDEGDTFPTVYKMNRQATLKRLMEAARFKEVMFEVLADASLAWRLPKLRRFELAAFRMMKACRIPYPESNLIAVFERLGH
jgi:ubiquinone/menaquinone biosynthesis C-methylase UbiE